MTPAGYAVGMVANPRSVALSLDDTYHAELKDYARRNHWSMALAARLIVQEYLDAEKKEEDPES